TRVRRRLTPRRAPPDPLRSPPAGTRQRCPSAPPWFRLVLRRRRDSFVACSVVAATPIVPTVRPPRLQRSQTRDELATGYSRPEDDAMNRLVTTTYLEMTGPAELRPAARPGIDVTLLRAEIPCPELNRFLYTAVGARWWWYSRLTWDYARWRAYLARP